MFVMFSSSGSVIVFHFVELIIHCLQVPTDNKRKLNGCFAIASYTGKKKPAQEKKMKSLRLVPTREVVL